MADPQSSDAHPTIRTDVPARLDRLPWARWHWLIVIGLGTVWILDGLEVTIIGNLSGQLSKPGSGLEITQSQVTGLGAAMYVAGACSGALLFGWLTDRYGRRRLFMLTLALYLAATALTALSFESWWFFLFRFLTGLGIGGEYAAINSAIDELIPARFRGRVDIVINGTYWLGAAFGALMTIPLLTYLPTLLGWRLAFAIGMVLGLAILLVRRNVPESPRWMFIHGRDRKADELVGGIEREVAAESGERLAEPRESIVVHPRKTIGFLTIARTMFRDYPRRSVLGLSLFIGQAFLYNAMLAHLFDTVGRKPMITGTYVASGIALFGTAWLFHNGSLTALTLTLCWCVVLFFASAGTSSAYLTVSEIFPMETRALAIAFFYAIGTAAGGISGPLLFAKLVGTGQVADTAVAFVIGASLMVAAGLVEAALGVRAERRSLEDLARPLTAHSAG